jgi:ABC-type metal ion transport system substrate-binding protein
VCGAIWTASGALSKLRAARRGAIAIQNAESPYTNAIAVQAKDKDRPQVKQFIEAKRRRAVIAG